MELRQLIRLPPVRERLDELREELEGFPCWQTEDGRLSLLQFYLQQGWLVTWEVRVLLRQAARSPRAELYANQFFAGDEKAGCNDG